MLHISHDFSKTFQSNLTIVREIVLEYIGSLHSISVYYTILVFIAQY
jgi:hypothetical protein